jgi:hypothetical protein
LSPGLLAGSAAALPRVQVILPTIITPRTQPSATPQDRLIIEHTRVFMKPGQGFRLKVIYFEPQNKEPQNIEGKKIV